MEAEIVTLALPARPDRRTGRKRGGTPALAPSAKLARCEALGARGDISGSWRAPFSAIRPLRQGLMKERNLTQHVRPV